MNDLTVEEDKALEEINMSEWGDDQEVSSKDFMISKILPMQGMSKLVMDRKAQLGEYRDSVTGDLLGSIDDPLEFIPFHVEKTWIVQKEINGKFEYQGMEPINRTNEDRHWEMEIDGEKFRFDWNYMYYVILPKDVKKGVPTPYILSFRRTSVKGGKKLFTQMFVRNKQMKKTPASVVMKLMGKVTNNEKGTFVVLDVESGRNTNKDELAAAFEMYKMVKAGEAKVDHSDIEKTERKGNYANDNVEF